jgi:EAL domain-containing protein (putative c-di-GMP-specific phosphodiesterase class I)/GGDEF domain-containing protein
MSSIELESRVAIRLSVLDWACSAVGVVSLFFWAPSVVGFSPATWFGCGVLILLKVAIDGWCWRRAHISGVSWLETSEVWAIVALHRYGVAACLAVLLLSEVGGFVARLARGLFRPDSAASLAIRRELWLLGRSFGLHSIVFLGVSLGVGWDEPLTPLSAVLVMALVSAFFLAAVSCEMVLVRQVNGLAVALEIGGQFFRLQGYLFACGALAVVVGLHPVGLAVCAWVFVSTTVALSGVQESMRWSQQIYRLADARVTLVKPAESLDEVRAKIVDFVSAEMSAPAKMVNVEPSSGLAIKIPDWHLDEWLWMPDRPSTVPMQAQKDWFNLLSSFASSALNATDSYELAVNESLKVVLTAAELRDTQDELADKDTQLTSTREQLEFERTHDAMTMLSNRRAVTRKAVELLDERAPHRLVVVTWTVPSLNRVVVHYGEPAGISLMRQVAVRWRATAPADAIIGFSPDTGFIAAMPLDPGKSADRLLGSIRAALPNHPEDALMVPTADGLQPVLALPRIGLAELGIDADSVEELITIAASVQTDATSNDVIVRRAMVEHDKGSDYSPSLEFALYQALATKSRDLEVHYQPIVDIVTGETVAAEALVRWRHDGAMQNPAEFVAMAEDSCLIEALSAFVFDSAAAAARRWTSLPGANHIPVSVNVSPRLLESGVLQPMITKALDQSGLSASLLKLEITEGIHLDATSESVQKTLTRLTSNGHVLSIDDFGMGYSSMSQMQSLPFGQLKIDREFVRNIEFERGARETLLAMRLIARSRHMETVAEGVENPGQLAVLNKLDVRFVQGWVFAKAMPYDEFVAWMLDPVKVQQRKDFTERHAHIEPVALPEPLELNPSSTRTTILRHLGL